MCKHQPKTCILSLKDNICIIILTVLPLREQFSGSPDGPHSNKAKLLTFWKALRTGLRTTALIKT